MTSRIEQYKKVQEEALDLFARKNKDYGDAFATAGPIGVLVRMGDKLNRLQNITKFIHTIPSKFIKFKKYSN